MRSEHDFTLRAATFNDAAALAEIGATTFYHTFRPYNTEEDMQKYLAKSYSLKQTETNLRDPKVHYFLCEKDDLCIGYIKMIEDTTYNGIDDNAIELEKIYIMHEYFGTAAGKLLMQKAIDFAKESDFKALFLGVWQENKRAVSFYLKNGFNTVTTRQFKLGETICDDFIMMKKL